VKTRRFPIITVSDSRTGSSGARDRGKATKAEKKASGSTRRCALLIGSDISDILLVSPQPWIPRALFTSRFRENEGRGRGREKRKRERERMHALARASPPVKVPLREFAASFRESIAAPARDSSSDAPFARSFEIDPRFFPFRVRFRGSVGLFDIELCDRERCIARATLCCPLVVSFGCWIEINHSPVRNERIYSGHGVFAKLRRMIQRLANYSQLDCARGLMSPLLHAMAIHYEEIAQCGRHFEECAFLRCFRRADSLRNDQQPVQRTKIASRHGRQSDLD